ncbi:MAG: UDP-N-acetylglucosamine 2-epimerase (non-hydrolyzing) [Rickettsiales bacterium]|nr:UDP-N-acetylglucosamine 2-epimerase (non-hydrolyzing) [Rickettsiales bacterium]|tara:strand:+ start:2350 stop:3399 length:1050 start_codon:yes stop_codon:yes gene_type:complete
MSKRIVTIVGARPQFIKAAAISREIKKYTDIEEIIIHTGQHFDKNMSDVFFDELEIPKPKYFLDIHSSSHSQMTGKMLAGIEDVLLQEKPDIVLVYGDTNSTLAGALASSKMHIPIAHVEAGLRSFNKKMPEEINRVLTDHVSNLLFCPTKQAVRNLKAEGITSGVYHVGDIMCDATVFANNYISKNLDRFVNQFDLKSGDFALMTIHRQESTNDEETFNELMSYAKKFSEKNNLKIFFPVHPRIKKLIQKYKEKNNFYFLDPLSYFETQYLLSKASFVLTDSGGLQKEAYFHRVPCITLRSETEWIETLESGWNRLWTVDSYNSRKPIIDYGLGYGAKSIVEILSNRL